MVDVCPRTKKTTDMQDELVKSGDAEKLSAVLQRMPLTDTMPKKEI